MIKDKNSKNLTEAEEVAKTHRRIKQKGLSYPDNYDDVAHLEPSWSVKSGEPDKALL